MTRKPDTRYKCILCNTQSTILTINPFCIFVPTVKRRTEHETPRYRYLVQYCTMNPGRPKSTIVKCTALVPVPEKVQSNYEWYGRPSNKGHRILFPSAWNLEEEREQMGSGIGQRGSSGVRGQRNLKRRLFIHHQSFNAKNE